MGLDTTHGCWHGAYSGFNRFRTEIATLAGIELCKMEGFSEGFSKPGTIKWDSLPKDDIHILLNHSDCDGEILHGDCLPLANRMKELLPEMSYETKIRAEKFIEGLLLANEKGENVEFA